MSEVLAAGGQVWAGDEPALREFPPLRAAWAPVGDQAAVVLTGRNGRRVVHGALDLRSGEHVCVVRERGRGEDCAALIDARGARHPSVPKLLVGGNAPPHHARVVSQAAEAATVELAWRPLRAPELNPCEDLWRRLKGAVAANRVYPSLDELGRRALAWLDALAPEDALRLAGLRSSKSAWLPT